MSHRRARIRSPSVSSSVSSRSSRLRVERRNNPSLTRRAAAELSVGRDRPGRRPEPSRRRGRRPRWAHRLRGRGPLRRAFGPIGTQLYAVDPDGSDRVLLLDCDVIRPQWSPDGSRLALTIGLDDGSWQVATIAADGSDLQLLTSGPGIHEIPSWSPDGTWLAYDSSDVGLDDPTFQATLWRIDADGSDAALLGDPDTFDVEPRISPDGSQVAFMRIHPEADYAAEIVVRDLASGDERVVVPLDVPVEHPEWSPDGSSLIFNAQDSAPDATTIYTIDLDAPEAAPVVLLDPATGDGWVASSRSTPRTARTSCSSASTAVRTASASWTPTART